MMNRLEDCLAIPEDPSKDPIACHSKHSNRFTYRPDLAYANL